MTALQTRWTARALLTLVVLVSAVAADYMGNYTVYMAPDLLRNVRQTEQKEGVAQLTAGVWLHMVLYAGLPAALTWRVGIEQVSWKPAALGRAAAMLFNVLVLAIAVNVVVTTLPALAR